MENQSEILALISAFAPTNCKEIPVSAAVFSPELRELCEQNACGRFCRNYTCPPLIGEVDELIDKCNSYTKLVLWQNVYPLEDSFDFEGMMDAQIVHNEMTKNVAQKVYAEFGRENALVLGAGGCSLCEVCAVKTSEPCRFPLDRIASVEAYGMNVSRTAAAADMKYINGVNTVTYFSGCFYR